MAPRRKDHFAPGVKRQYQVARQELKTYFASVGWPAGKTRSWKTTGSAGVNVVSRESGAASRRTDWWSLKSQVSVARKAGTGPES